MFTRGENMSRIIYMEKTYTVTAGSTLADILFRRSGEKQVYLHYLNISTDANTYKADVYFDGYKFIPTQSASSSFAVGKNLLFDKVEINDSISISITASSSASATVAIHAYIEVSD
jgi:hypothetical protein